MSRFSVDRMSGLQKNHSIRMSMLLNEDDFDYALELGPDDEYRQAAEALPRLVDFDEIDLSNLIDEEEESDLVESNQNETIQPFAGPRQTRASITEMNTKRNRMSNFDAGMMEMHATAKPRRSSVQTTHPNNNHNSNNNNNNHTDPQDEPISDWGAVDNETDEQDELSEEELFFDPQNPSDPQTTYDRRITGMGTVNGEEGGINFNATSNTADSGDSSFSSRFKRLSKKEFSFRLNMLKQHRKWIERAARRSSIGFHRHHPSSDKEAMDRFLVALAGGVHVRRHQGYRLSELVRLYSVTGCRTIEWDKPKARDLHAQRNKSGVLTEGGTSAVINSNYDKSAFDCCIAICGCGDDLNAGHDAHQHAVTNMNVDNVHEDRRYVSFGRTFYNIGYRRRGTFRDLDVLAVHPAGKEDPTVVGMLGTECLRRTKDAFNAELTFSVIIRDTTSGVGYSTLDIECEAVDTYYLLLRGFRLLQEEAEVHRAQSRPVSGLGSLSDDLEAGLQNNPINNTNSNNNSSTSIKAAIMQSQRVEELAYVWNSIKGYVTGGAWESPSTNPIDDLFSPTNTIDPLRALRVGGGLLPKHSVKISSPGSVTSGGNGASSTRGAHNTTHNTTNTNTNHSTTNNTNNTTTTTNKSLPLAQFLGWNSAGTQIWARLKMAGLDVKCVLSWDLKRVILKIRCPAWRLEQMAEQMHIKLKSRDGYLKQFKVNRRDTFVAMGSGGSMFRSSERQQIIDYIIRSKIKDGGAELDEYTELGHEIVQRFPLHMYSKLHDITHTWVTFWKQHHYHTTTPAWSPFTTSYSDTYIKIKQDVNYTMANLLTQPLDAIAEYFGESIAFYFAYMAFYTRWLVFPSVLGVIVFAVQLSSDRLDHWICPLYAILVMVWACFMLAFWRQKASALAHRWGVLDYEVEETERPQFRGAYTYDESSGEVRKTYSLWKRTGKYFISIPVLSAAILVTLVIMTTVFYSQDAMVNDYMAGRSVNYAPKFPTFRRTSSNDDTSSGDSSDSSDSFSMKAIYNSNFWAATFFYPSMYGIIVSLLTKIFEFVAVWLNDFENHRTQTTYLNRLILKVFSFQFVTIFTSLYYYAFAINNSESAFYQICVTVFSLMTVGQWWQVFLDIAVPSIYHRALLYRMRSAFSNTNRKIYKAREYTDQISRSKGSSSNSGSNMYSSNSSSTNNTNTNDLTYIMSQKLDKRRDYLEQAKSKCWEEALQAKYNNFADYTRMVIQIGFVLFFSAVFPLCPLIALLNNIALIRLNALKICYTRQRPIAQKIGGIGVWEDVLQIMSVGGILTNCALYGFTSNIVKNVLVPSVGKIGMAIILFAYEHAILLFKYWLHSSIPTVHPSVQRARTRERKSSDRKSLLRSQKTKRNSVLVSSISNNGGVGGSSGTSGNGGTGGVGGVGVGSGAKPLRARNSSMLGYWFDLSARVAGDHSAYNTNNVSAPDAQCMERDSCDEGSSLIPSPSHTTQNNTPLHTTPLHIHNTTYTPTHTPFTMKRSSLAGMPHPLQPLQHPHTTHTTHTYTVDNEYKSSSSDEWNPDEPPDSPYNTSPYTTHPAHTYNTNTNANKHYTTPVHPSARALLSTSSDEEVPPSDDEVSNVVNKEVQSKRPRASLSPPRSTKQLNPTTTSRRSLSPTRMNNASNTISRDEMISMIRANIDSNVHAPPVQVHINMNITQAGGSSVPVVEQQVVQQYSEAPAPAGTVQVPRRVSFLTDAALLAARNEQYHTAITNNPSTEYHTDNSDVYSEYSDYQYSDCEVSDLSEEASYERERVVYDTSNTSSAGAAGGKSSGKGVSGSKGKSGGVTRSKGTGKASSGTKNKVKVQSGTYTTPTKTTPSTTNKANYSPLQMESQKTKHTTTTNTTTNTALPPPSMNVQSMLTNWFWPSKPVTTTTTKHSNKSLNIAPLGTKKATTNTTNNTTNPTNTNHTTVNTPSRQISSPSSNFFQLNEAVSPYAELVSGNNSPMLGSANNSGSNGNSNSNSGTNSGNVSGANSGKGVVTPPRKANRDVSPQRVSTSINNTNTINNTNASGKKRTPVHTPTHTPIQSPFSYVETHTNPTNPTSNTTNNTSVCKENEMILANLPTEQLQQLLLLQAAHANKAPTYTVQGNTTPKRIRGSVTNTNTVTTPTNNNNSNTASPTRSALAGSRKKQVQVVQPVHVPVTGQSSPNPYHTLLHSHTHATPHTPVSGANNNTDTTPVQRRRSSTRHPGNDTTPRTTHTNHTTHSTPRRASTTRTPGGVAQAYLNAVGSAQKGNNNTNTTTTPGHSENNPFSFAVQRKPERVMYD